jgi:hypothetical protein
MVKNQMIDNNSYNILQAFVSTLEALEAYQKYSKDGNEQLWQQVMQHTEEVARILQQKLPQALQQNQGATASQSSGKQSTMSHQSGSQGATQSQSSR